MELPNLGTADGYANAMLPEGVTFDKGLVYDAGPYRMKIGKNAFSLTPEELYILGKKIDAELSFGYDGNHELNASAPASGGRMSYQGKVGSDGSRHEVQADL